MKNIILIILILISNQTYSKSLAEDNFEFLQEFEKKCSYSFEDNIRNSITSHQIEGFIFEKTEYKIFRFHIKIKLEKKITEAKLEFTCPSIAIDPPRTPEQIIKEEDAGGRYFRHIAWQREIFGKNWQGLIAYSDYLFGDSKKIKTYDYLICQKYSQCFSYSINTEPQLKIQEQEATLNILKNIIFSK